MDFSFRGEDIRIVDSFYGNDEGIFIDLDGASFLKKSLVDNLRKLLLSKKSPKEGAKEKTSHLQFVIGVTIFPVIFGSFLKSLSNRKNHQFYTNIYLDIPY